MATLAFGPFLLDPAASRLQRDGVEVQVQPKVLDLLAALATRPGLLMPREVLTELLWPGVHVSPNVLDQALRKVRAALGDDPAAPRYIEAVPRRGWRFVAPVQAVTSAPEGLVGRGRELAELRQRADESGPVLLWGPPGVGKSRLAEAALPAADEVVWVTLSDRDRDVAAVAMRVQAALGLALSAGDGVERIGAALAGRDRVQLVVDGVDEPTAATLDALAGWCRAAPGLALLVTSRRRLPLGGTDVPLGPLAPADAHTLLRARLPAGHPGLDDDAAAVLLARLDGLPLAIELAAARLRVLTPEALAERLAARSLGGPLEAALQNAWDALDPVQRRVLAAATLPDRPFDAAEVEALVPEVPDPLGALQELVEGSLVRGGAGALHVLHSVRAFVRDRTAGDADRASLERRWAAAVHDAAAARTPDALAMAGPALIALHDRRADLAALVGDEDVPAELRCGLAVGLALALRYVGPWEVARTALERVEREGRDDGAAWALLGEYRLRAGEVAGGLAALDRARQDRSVRVRALAGVLAARASGDEATALQALADAREANAPGLEALAADAAAAARARAGDVAAAERRSAEAVAAASAPGLAAVRAMVLQNAAARVGAAGEHGAAALLFAAAVADLEGLPFPHLAAAARVNLGMALVQGGRDEAALDALLQAAEALRRIGDRAHELRALPWAATAALLADQVEAAERCAGRLEALAEGPSAAVDLALIRALIAWARGRAGEAEAPLALATVLAAQSGEPRLQGEVQRFAVAFDGWRVGQQTAVGDTPHERLLARISARPKDTRSFP